MKKTITNPENISHFWVMSIMIIYGLILAEYFYLINLKTITIENVHLISNPIFTYLQSFSFIMTVLIAIVIWLISSFIFHLFAILLGGEANFKDFQKYTGLCYIFPAISLCVALVLFDNIDFPKKNLQEFFNSNGDMILINWIITISSTLCFVLPIFIIKYLYKMNWLKAVGAVVIPLGSIHLLGQFFAEFVL
ncbi:YIP1 family protein [Flavobacterium piscis]|uniref:Magnesium-transporting ATPase (P-type) n=1 Tax=Flavobacterium piscis TaxID=1114874 RepID=A0ABU1Y8K3_9FLAO|nr:YIP1 family protein [Flavobacterium piscis]MDR7210567.1 magnesium-transporting ATPase (P-type) [Flavobacterium piscis]